MIILIGMDRSVYLVCKDKSPLVVWLGIIALWNGKGR